MTAATERPLELVPVGAGAAYGRPGETQSSYLVRGHDRSVLLDLGAGSLNVLSAIERPENLDLIVVSHLHPDHVADLFALRVYMAWGPGRGGNVAVLGPAGLREMLVAFAGEEGWDPGLTFETAPDTGVDVSVGALELSLRPVPHQPPTFAVRIDGPTGSVCYSADCAPSRELVELARGCDVLLAECSFGVGPVPEDVPHLDAEMAGSIAREAGVGRLVLTHIFPECDAEAAVHAAAAEFGGLVEWARSGRAIPTRFPH